MFALPLYTRLCVMQTHSAAASQPFWSLWFCSPLHLRSRDLADGTHLEINDSGGPHRTGWGNSGTSATTPASHLSVCLKACTRTALDQPASLHPDLFCHALSFFASSPITASIPMFLGGKGTLKEGQSRRDMLTTMRKGFSDQYWLRSQMSL